MGAQLGLPDALRRRGLVVEVVPGWETRSAGSFYPVGAVCHWTAGPRGTLKRPSLSICTTGRADLPGPLCNVYGDRNGVAVVVAAGRANHAGAGSWRGATGNSSFFGTEMEAAGPDDFTDAQRRAYPLINAAFCDLGGFGADMVCGHSEYATPRGRKTDINNYPMTAMRAQVAAILAGPRDRVPDFTSKEDDMTPAESATLTFVARLLDPNVPGSLGAMVRQSTEILSVPIHSTVPGSTVQLTPRDMLASVDNSTYGTAQQVTALVASLQAISDAVRSGSGGLTEAQAIAAGQAGAKAALADLGRDLAAIGRT